MKNTSIFQPKLTQTRVLMLAAFFLLISAAHTCAQDVQLYKGAKLISHRGKQFGFPENSLAAIKAVIKNGIHGVEVDLRTTADGHIVIIHDERLERSTTGTGKVREKSWSEMQQLYLKDSTGTVTACKVPDLHSVLALVAQHPQVVLGLDLKDVDAVQVAQQVLDKGVQKQVLFFVADPMDTQLAKSITGVHPELRIIVDMLSWWKIEDIRLFAAKALETDLLFASEWFFPKRGFHHLRKNGIEVVVYLWGTHDLVERYKKAADLGASYVSTDNPLFIVSQMHSEE